MADDVAWDFDETATVSDLWHMKCPWCRQTFGDMAEMWEGIPGGVPHTGYEFECPECMKPIKVFDVDITLYFDRVTDE
jgi:hypothetical protein